MNAIQFIQQNGVDKAREVVNVAPDRATTVKPSLDFKHFMYGICENAAGAYILLSELKHLVESVDLIKKHGGLFSTKCQLDKGGSDYEWYGENGDYGLTDLGDLEQAIADYESIYSIPESVRQAILNLEMHL